MRTWDREEESHGRGRGENLHESHLTVLQDGERVSFARGNPLQGIRCYQRSGSLKRDGEDFGGSERPRHRGLQRSYGWIRQGQAGAHAGVPQAENGCVSDVPFTTYPAGIPQESTRQGDSEGYRGLFFSVTCPMVMASESSFAMSTTVFSFLK